MRFEARATKTEASAHSPALGQCAARRLSVARQSFHCKRRDAVRTLGAPPRCPPQVYIGFAYVKRREVCPAGAQLARARCLSPARKLRDRRVTSQKAPSAKCLPARTCGGLRGGARADSGTLRARLGIACEDHVRALGALGALRAAVLGTRGIRTCHRSVGARSVTRALAGVRRGTLQLDPAGFSRSAGRSLPLMPSPL